MIRVAIVDDHPAVRIGLETAVHSEWGLISVGTADQAEDVPALLYSTQPDVVLLDYRLPRHDGLSVCLTIKADAPAPAVVLYSAYADASLVVPAIVAGADGIVHKGAPARDLFGAIRTVAAGGSALPAVSGDLLNLAAAAVDPADLPILGMLVNRTPRRDIADTLHISTGILRERVADMLRRLKLPQT
jgi:DNA-binding NarL/FixJ family response regulator